MFASRRVVRSLTLTLVLACTVAAAYAQTPPAQPALGAKTGAPVPAAAATTGVALPADYVIGPEDVLGVLFWREQDMSGDVTVRPDGMITLPLIGESHCLAMGDFSSIALTATMAFGFAHQRVCRNAPHTLEATVRPLDRFTDAERNALEERRAGDKTKEMKQ